MSMRATRPTSTKAAASAFLTLALESNWDALRQSEQYLKYIATRPRAERLGSNGLIRRQRRRVAGKNDGGTGAVHRKRVDAHLLAQAGGRGASGLRQRRGVENIIRAHRNEIAAAMKIPPADFRWYAAFHNEGEHPRPLMAWSAKPGQAYLTKEGIRQIKSRLTNDIFRDEMLHLYEQKSASRTSWCGRPGGPMQELLQAMQGGLCDHPEAEQLMQELAAGWERSKERSPTAIFPSGSKRAGG